MKLFYMPGGRDKPWGNEVKVGDEIVLTHNEPKGGRRVYVTGIELPRHPASTGRVYVEDVRNRNGVFHQDECYFPSVIDADWDERPDQVAASKRAGATKIGYE